MGASTRQRWSVGVGVVLLLVAGCGVKSDSSASSAKATATVTATVTQTATETATPTTTPTPTATENPTPSFSAFTRSWYAHTSFLTVSRTGAVHEFVGDGCCDPIIDLRYQLSHPRQQGPAWVADATVTAVKLHHYTDRRPPPKVGDTYQVRVQNGFFYPFSISDWRYCDEAVQPGQCGA